MPGIKKAAEGNLQQLLLSYMLKRYFFAIECGNEKPVQIRYSYTCSSTIVTGDQQIKKEHEKHMSFS
jgi:hypothetical protein